MRITDFLVRLLWLPISALAAAVLVTAIMLMDDDPPGTYVPGSQQVEIEPDRVLLSYRFVRRRACSAVMTRSIVDPVGRLEHLAPMTYTAAQIEDLQSIGRDRVSLVLPKPARVIPGVYLMQANVEYACNRAQEVWPIRVGFSVPFRLVE